MNEPLSHQLTVGQLRRALESIQDQAVVAIHMPAGYCSHPLLATFVNLKVLRAESPVVVLAPQDEPVATEGTMP